MLNFLLDRILSLHGNVVYVVVGLLVFAEAAIMIGFVFPGETAALLGGVIASYGHCDLAVLIPVVVGCAILGDTVGYAVGARYGPRLLRTRLIRRRVRLIDTATDLINRRGAAAVFLGRFTAFLRAMVPGLAGMSDLRYHTFLWANALGGAVWGTLFCLLGYAFGGAYKKVESVSSAAGWVLLAVVALAVVVVVMRGRRRERAMVAEHEGQHQSGPEEG